MFIYPLKESILQTIEGDLAKRRISKESGLN
jgi:hypothetical protein